MSLCQLRQFRISSALDAGRPLSQALRRHIDSCPHCRGFAEKSGSLAATLAQHPEAAQSPPWLHTKIMAQVGAAEAGSAPAPARRWMPALAGAASIALVVALVSTLNRRDDDTGSEVAKTGDLVWEEPPIHPAEVTASFEKHAKRALSKEIQNLATDITGARNFLSASIRSTIPGLD